MVLSVVYSAGHGMWQTSPNLQEVISKKTNKSAFTYAKSAAASVVVSVFVGFFFWNALMKKVRMVGQRSKCAKRQVVVCAFTYFLISLSGAYLQRTDRLVLHSPVSAGFMELRNGGSSRKVTFSENFSGTPGGGTGDSPGQVMSLISSPFRSQIPI